MDGILFDGPKINNFEVSINRLNIGVLENVVLEGMDKDVKKNYLRTIEVLKKSGANLRTINSKVFERVIQLQGQPKIVSAEANSEFESILALKGMGVDPRVSTRITKGKEITSAVYIQTLVERKLLIQAWRQEFLNDDVWVMPTVPVIAPLLDDLRLDEKYFECNSLMLRNPGLINFLDGCALSIPNHFGEEPPTGLMLVSPGNTDESLLRCGVAVEKMLSTLC
jgi:aspartyl-tRNA(Asn)/glutamyl-tRNA(Gln) amidotransferase subunit A